VRCSFGDWEGELAGLAATAAHLVPAEVAGDVIDAVSVWNRFPASTTSFTSSATRPSRIMRP